MTRNKFRSMIDKIETASVSYEIEVRQIMQKWDSKIAEIKSTYNPSSPKYAEAIQQAKDSKQRELTALKADYLSMVQEDANEIEFDLMDELKKVNTEKIAKLQPLSGIPLTESELRILNDKYGNSGYWESRFLFQLATENDIAPSSVGITPSYDTRKSLLQETVKLYSDFISKYEIDAKDLNKRGENIRLKAGVASTTMQRAYLRYIGSNAEPEDISNALSKAITDIRSSHDDETRGKAIAKALKDFEDNPLERNRLLYKISTNADITDAAVKFSGVYANEIRIFKQHNAQAYKTALDAMTELSATDNKELVSRKLVELSGNEYFGEMIADASHHSGTIREAREHYKTVHSESEV